MKGAGMRRLIGMLLCACSISLLAAPPASALVSGTAHDFSGRPMDTTGICSPCHIPHKADTPGAGKPKQPSWARDLNEEEGYYSQDSNPNYIPDSTLACYDCHDNQQSIGGADDSPDPGANFDPFDSVHGPTLPANPQDIALEDWPGAQGTGDVGYYEKSDGTLNPPGPELCNTAGHFWISTPSGVGAPDQGDKLACWLCHEPHNDGTGTNEVFFRDEYFDGTSWQSFPSSPTNLTASPNTRVGDGRDPAVDNGREMCAVCHDYSDDTLGPNVPVTMYGVTLPSPPTTISAHDFDASINTPCTNCHEHNKICVSCDSCHGYPPLNNQPWDATTNPNGYSADYSAVPAENPAEAINGARVHRRHFDALGAVIFQCEICHGPSPGSATWHNTGGDVVSQGNINIMGLASYWEAGLGLTPGYRGSAAGPASGDVTNYPWSQMGGGDSVCFGLACHGDPPNLATGLAWTDNMVDDGGEAGPFKMDICDWCHGATGSAKPPASASPDKVTALINGLTGAAPTAMGTGGLNTDPTNWGAEVNGHGLSGASYDRNGLGDQLGAAGAAKDCDVCHDATYNPPPIPPPTNDPAEKTAVSPIRTHFGAGTDPRDEKRLLATINGVAIGTGVTFPTGPDQACTACHQNAGADAGTQVASHGSTPNAECTPLEPVFQSGCRQCHDVHGRTWNGTNRNLYMIGTWVDTVTANQIPDAGEEARVDSNAAGPLADITTADNAVVFTSRTGADSFDEIGSPDEGVDAAANADDICGTCHDYTLPITGPNYTGGGDHSGSANINGDWRGTDCTFCHKHIDYNDNLAASPFDAFLGPSCYKCHSQNGTFVSEFAPPPPLVDDAAGDDFGFTSANPGRLKHELTFAVCDSWDCNECHELDTNHADGNTYNDLADPEEPDDGIDWPISAVDESLDTDGSAGQLIEFCLDCHDGDARTFFTGGLTAPGINTFVDVGPDGIPGNGDDITNQFGHEDMDIGGPSSNYAGQDPPFYDTASGGDNDPPLGYTGEPMFAHFTQGDTLSGTRWWDLGALSTWPHPYPCLDCHYAHGGPNEVNYRSPDGATGLGGEKYGTNRAICLNCHDSANALQGRVAPDPTTGHPGPGDPLNDRYGNPVIPHDAAETTGCSTGPGVNACHNPHAPSCEICHGYPP